MPVYVVLKANFDVQGLDFRKKVQKVGRNGGEIQLFKYSTFLKKCGFV